MFDAHVLHGMPHSGGVKRLAAQKAQSSHPPVTLFIAALIAQHFWSHPLCKRTDQFKWKVT